jgi:hypothetical protein
MKEFDELMNEPLHTAKGLGTLSIYDDRIVIGWSKLVNPGRPERVIYFNELKAIDFKTAGMVNGFIHFVVDGVKLDKEITPLNASQDENTIIFNTWQQKQFEVAKKVIDAKVSGSDVKLLLEDSAMTQTGSQLQKGSAGQKVKKAIGIILGVIGAIIFLLSIAVFISLVTEKKMTSDTAFGAVISMLFTLALFGLPFYFLVIAPNKGKSKQGSKEKMNLGSALLDLVSFPFTGLTARKLFYEIIAQDRPWKQVLDEIENRRGKKLSLGVMRSIGKRLFEYNLKAYIQDLHLASEEINQLEEIRVHFGLSTYTVTSIKNRYNKMVVDQLSKLKLADKVLSDEDKKELYQLAEALSLPAATVDAINRNNAIKIFNEYKDRALSDRRLTPEEEQELLELKRNLQLSDNDVLTSQQDREEYFYCKLLWEVENGILPEIESPVLLQKNEVCHIAIDATRLETKVVTTGYTGGSRGVSIRIAKGVSYRVGGYRSRPIKEEVTFRYPGSLVITSKRIVFMATEKGFSIPLNKLDSIDPYQDGIGFQKGATYYLLTMKYPDLVGLIITSAVNNL